MERTLVFDPRNLADLFAHYTEGRFPLGATITNMQTNEFHTRIIGFTAESDQWEDEPIAMSELHDKSLAGGHAILMLRYEGRKVMSWGNKHDEVVWKDADNFADQRSKG